MAGSREREGERERGEGECELNASPISHFLFGCPLVVFLKIFFALLNESDAEGRFHLVHGLNFLLRRQGKAAC